MAVTDDRAHVETCLPDRDRLDALAENRDAVLWERASVKLDESANGHADDGADR